jgi:hypothetical protein
MAATPEHKSSGSTEDRRVEWRGSGRLVSSDVARDCLWRSKIARAMYVLFIERLSCAKIGRAALPPGPLATTGFLTRACSVQPRLLGTEWRTTSTTSPILAREANDRLWPSSSRVQTGHATPFNSPPICPRDSIAPKSCPIVFIILPYPSVEMSC